MKADTGRTILTKTSEIRRRLILGGISAVALPTRVSADKYLSKPIRTIVPWPAGGVADVVTRRLTPHLESFLGQSVIVENRGGAAGQLGAQFVARAVPDGYTLLRGDIVCLVLAPSFAAQPLYDPISDFAAISMTGRSPMLLVVPASLEVRTLEDLIVLAKSHPGQLNYATVVGATSYVITERFKQAAGVDLRPVAYKGDGPMLTDLIAGHVQVMFAFNSVVIPFIRSGKLKALVVTGDKRVPTLPDVPTVIEAGYPELIFGGWGAYFAPRGTSRAIIDTLNAAIVRSIMMPDIQKIAQEQGTEPMPSSPEECGEYLKAELSKWAPVIKATGVRL
jgi:tripartite-type tricarboxylate transporter receptor subunit TctC